MVQMMVQSYRRALQEFSESSVMSKCKSLSSSNLLTGAPQSITEWLTLWEKDPVEILLDLGFGTEEPDVCTKIPPRFLSGASVAKGINIRVFLEAQKQRIDIERPNLYERFRQLEVLDRVTSALSSLLTGINTQQTNLLDTTRSRPVVTQAKRRIGQHLKRASRQTLLLKQGFLVPGEANLPSRKEQPCSSADTAERERVQAYSHSAHVTLNSLTEGQTPRDKGASTYLTSQCPPTPSGKAWAPLHLVAKPFHLSPASEVPAKDRPRKEPPLFIAHTLKKVANLNCKLPDSFEMEEIQSFEDETLYGNASDIALDMMVTRTSSCQSDSSGFIEDWPEPAGLQNASSSGKIDFISDIHNQGRTLSHEAGFPMLNQDFQQEPDDCVAKVFITACESILTVPGSMKACSNQGEETHLLLTSENIKYQARKTEAQSFVKEMVCDEGKKEKTERKQLEKERCIKEQRPCLQRDSEDDPGSSKFDSYLYFSKGHKKANVTFTELSDLNDAVINENKIRGENECKKCWTEKDIGVVRNEGAHGGSTGHVKGPRWDVEVSSKDDTLLAANEVTNRQQLCKMNGDSKNTRCSPIMGVPETLQWISAPQSGNSVASLPVSERHPSCLTEWPGSSSSEDQETSSTREMLGTNKSEQGDAPQKGEMSSALPKSVTVQMSSGLEFTPRAKGTGQNASLGECLAREDPVDFSTLAHCSEGAPLLQSEPGALKGGVKHTMEASSQTDIPIRKPGWPPLLCSPHTHLTKSASLDSMVCGKYRSRYGGEASGTRGVQGSHCCHCCCCYGCCPWTFPVAVSPQCPVGCCSSHATTELHLLKTSVLLQDTATHNPAPCTLNEIEAMKSSCQHFQEKLDEIEEHLTEQQVLFSSTMPDEGREEARHLQLLCRAVRQEVAELEFQLRDQVCQVKESILMQLDQLLAEQSHLFSELGLSDWKGERKAQNKQTFSDAADTEHLQSGCSKMVLPKAPSKTTTATGSLSAPQLEAPSMQFPTRTMPESNSVKSAPQELSTSTKEIKGTPQANMDFKSFIHNVK